MKNKKDRFVLKDEIPHSKIYHYDVIILGAGPAGLTAAIYSSRYGMKTGLISKDIGGTANYAKKIENYPGFEGNGIELMQKIFKQARSFGADFLNDDVLSFKKDSNGFIVYTVSHKIVHTKSIIIALGTQRKKLNIEGEDKFLGKGVSYCAACDSGFFKGKDVAVIGGCDSAALDALILSGIANKVYFIYRGNKERCEEITSKKLHEKKNIEFIYNAVPVKVKGKDSVEEIVIEKNGKEKSIKVSGIFIEIGSLPVSDIAKMLKIKIDDKGYIKTQENMKTNVSGIFAAGDVVKSNLKQIIVAAAQGAIAAKSAFDYVSGK